MSDLLANNPDAAAWITREFAAHADENIFARLASSVIWSNATDAKGVLLVPFDPVQLVSEINASPFPLFLGHDPGKPLGKVVRAEVFENPTGEVFVAAVLGFYGSPTLGFGELGIDPTVEAAPLVALPALPDSVRFQLAADPREVDLPSLSELVREAPVPVDIKERSNNSADALHSFVTVTVLFLALVWNPLVTTFANEASKDAYAALRAWLKKLSAHIAKGQDPVVELQSWHGDCCISFMFRGRDISRHYAAHDMLAGAAARAAHLLTQMQAGGLKPIRLVYEFHATDDLWYPSFAELSDGRIVSDNAKLIAVENLPRGLSLGIVPPSSSGPGL